ncbi:MAG: response regulator [Chloroflexi bacterium]|nr:response regulator [Chloroflexota bacterium]
MMTTQKKHILIVDDDPELQRMIGMFLYRAGYEVSKANDGGKGLTAVSKNKPDLIIADVMMSKMDGMEMVRRLRAQNSTRHIPIIMLSALGDVDNKVKGFDAGADDYLAKPVDSKELLARIRALLNRVHIVPEDSGKIVSLIGAKGGVGVTAVAVNLGVILAQQNKSVILVELRSCAGDLNRFLQLPTVQKNLTSLAGMEPEKIKKRNITRCLVTHSSGLKALPAAAAYNDLGLTAVHIDAILENLSHEAEYILLDCPAQLNPGIRTALEMSDQILLLTEPDPLSVSRAQLIVENFKQWELFDRANMVLTQRSRGNAQLNRVEVEEAVGMSGGDHQKAARWETRALEVDIRTRQGVAGAIPPDPDRFNEAIRDRVPLVMIEPTAQSARALYDLAGWLTAKYEGKEVGEENGRQPTWQSVYSTTA